MKKQAGQEKNNKMSRLPRLKITEWIDEYPQEQICDLKQAKTFFDRDPSLIVIVDGEVLVSYDELINLATQDIYRDKEYIQAELAPLIGGG